MDRRKKAAKFLDDTFTKIHKRAPRNREEFDLWLESYSKTEAGKQMLRQMGRNPRANRRTSSPSAAAQPRTKNSRCIQGGA
jgi:hypothetical protein